MAGKPAQIRTAEIKQIVKMLFENRSDGDIMRELCLPERTFFRYKHQIYKQYADQFKQQQMSDIAYYSAKLHHKLTRYQNIVESKLDSCVDIKDTAVLIELATDLSTTIFEVETHRLETT